MAKKRFPRKTNGQFKKRNISKTSDNRKRGLSGRKLQS